MEADYFQLGSSEYQDIFKQRSFMWLQLNYHLTHMFLFIFLSMRGQL